MQLQTGLISLGKMIISKFPEEILPVEFDFANHALVQAGHNLQGLPSSIAYRVSGSGVISISEAVRTDNTVLVIISGGTNNDSFELVVWCGTNGSYIAAISCLLKIERLRADES